MRGGLGCSGGYEYGERGYEEADLSGWFARRARGDDVEAIVVLGEYAVDMLR